MKSIRRRGRAGRQRYMEIEAMNDNIFIHDAVPTWSGFLYQGQVAVYLAVKKIYELEAEEKKKEVNYYSIEMEKCEDIAVVYEGEECKQYESIHQVKNCEKKGINDYRSPLIQLMLEKGFCKENSYGEAEAYLHVARQITNENTFENEIKNWGSQIIRFHETLRNILCELKQDEDTYEILKRLKECVEDEPIKFNRTEYRKKLEKIKKLCGKDEEKKDLCESEKTCEKIDIHQVRDNVKELIDFLDQKLCVSAIEENIKIYRYDTGKGFCTGTEIFEHIVKYVKKYKSNKGNFCQEQYEYIADKMLSFVESKILERHQHMQEGKKVSKSIPLSMFMEILDEGIERYEEESNILTLVRKYNERIEAYCSICQEGGECLEENCRLQQSDVRRNMYEKDEFIKLCYNLNPECANTMNILVR